MTQIVFLLGDLSNTACARGAADLGGAGRKGRRERQGYSPSPEEHQLSMAELGGQCRANVEGEGEDDVCQDAAHSVDILTINF